MAEETSCTLDSVLETSNYFSSLIELIPSKYYLQDEEKQENGYNHMSKKLTKQNKKLLTKKAKMLRLDPAQHKSTHELQLEIEKKEKEMLKEDGFKERIKPIKVSEVSSVPLDELRERLHAKMEQVRGKRKHSEVDEKDWIKKSRMDRKDKKKKKKDSDKLSSNIKKATDTEGHSHKNGSIKNESGDIVFSKFDFATGNSSNSRKNKPKQDVKKLLEIAEKRKEKVEQLEEEDSEKAKELKDKIAWEKVFKKAEGQKLKDDPKLLKKTIKRKEKFKSQSQKKWKERTDTVENQKQEKQKLRVQHLKERRDSKKNPGKGKKKKSKPGF